MFVFLDRLVNKSFAVKKREAGFEVVLKLTCSTESEHYTFIPHFMREPCQVA